MRPLPVLFAALLLAGAIPSFAGNQMNDIVSKADEATRRKMFGALLNRIGESCLDVERTFFRGFDRSGAAHWAVTCQGGKSLGVSLSDRGNGTVRALDCNVLEKITKTKCFSKF